MAGNVKNGRRGLRLTRLFVATAVLLVMGASCGEDKTTAPEEEPHTIDELLVDWKDGYLKGDVTKYTSVFAEDFVFVSDPEDRKYDLDFPETWSRDEETMSLERLHGREDLTSLHLRTEIQSTAEPDSADGNFPHGTMKVVMYASMDSFFSGGETGEPFGAGGNGVQWLFLRQNEERTRAGQPMWEIFEWREARTGFGRPNRTIPSWGVIRHFFTQLP